VAILVIGVTSLVAIVVLIVPGEPDDPESIPSRFQVQRRAPRSGFPAVAALFPALAFIVSGLVIVGYAQLLRAFKDIAINTYLIAGPQGDDRTERTPVPDGGRAPPYRMIRFLEVLNMVCGVLCVLAGVVMLLVALLA
jgi:hypothetical protein